MTGLLMDDCQTDPLRPQFDRRLRQEFHGAAGLLDYRELDALRLTDTFETVLHVPQTGRNTSHGLVVLLWQSLFSRLAGYEDLDDVQRLHVDPAVRTVVGGRARDHAAALTSEICRFETETLTTRENLNRLMDLSGRWIGRASTPQAHPDRPRHGQLSQRDLRPAAGLGLQRPLRLHLGDWPRDESREGTSVCSDESPASRPLRISPFFLGHRNEAGVQWVFVRAG
jgi:hypothetical protein